MTHAIGMMLTAYHPLPSAGHEFDWQAWWSDDKDNACHVGYGRTEQEAIEDLERLDQERYEAEHLEEDPPWDTDAQ